MILMEGSKYAPTGSDVEAERFGEFLIRLGEYIRDGDVPVSGLNVATEVRAEHYVTGNIDLTYHLNRDDVNPLHAIHWERYDG